MCRSDCPNAGNTSLNQVQHVRAGGPPFVVTLSNSNAAVAQLRSDQPAATGQVVTKPIQPNIYYTNAVATGTSYGLAFDPLGGGTTTVTVTGPAGVGSVPPAGVTVAVTSAGISMPSPQTVGAGLQLSTPASLEGSQHGGVAVTVSSSAPGVLRVSPNATTAGTASFVVNVANGATSVPFYVQGVENTVGTAIVSVSAPGFTTGTVTMSVAQPAIEIVNLPTSANAAAGELTAWYVQVGVPNAGHTQLNQVQSVRTGGPAFVVTLSNSNDAVAELRSDEPVTTGQVVTKPIQPNFYYTNSIAPGTSQGLAFRPLAAGTTSVSATGPSGVIGVDGATRTVSVTGVPTLVSIAATDSDATEAGATTGTFTITRSAVTAQSLSVSYTRSGSATGGSDFTNFSSTSVFIPANQASVSITVTPIADQIVESPETVTLTLANGAGYDLGGSTQATVTIADDPTIVSIEAIDPDASEAGTNTGRFRLTRSGGSTAALSVSYTRSGTAVAGTDYSNNFSATAVTIPAGQSFVDIVVTPLVNVATEPPETVILTLSVDSPVHVRRHEPSHRHNHRWFVIEGVEVEPLVTARVAFGESGSHRRSASRLMVRKSVASTIGSLFAMVWVHRMIKESRMRVRAVGVLVAVLICSAALPAAAAPILSLTPSSTSVGVGDTFSIDVNVSDVDDLYGFQFDFNFDQSLLSPLGVTEGSFLSQGVSGSTDFLAGFDNGTGTIEFTLGFLLGAVPGVSGSGTLATLAFVATAPGNTDFSLSGLILLDSQLGEFQNTATINAAAVDINAAPVPETASTASLMVMATGVTILARRRLARSTR